MFKEHYAQMREEAKEAYPLEAVWFITETGCRQVENISPSPTTEFSVREQDTMQALEEGLLAVVHSHPDLPACPSEADMVSQLASDVPWGIIATTSTRAEAPVWWGGNTPIEPFETRTFRHGITDCYSLIKDYYQQELGITLRAYPRGWNWWDKSSSGYQNHYLDKFAAEGFVEIPLHDEDSTEFLGLSTEPKRGDMWFTQIHSEVPNHAGIYLGNSLCLHHLSGREPVDIGRPVLKQPIYRWGRHITHWFRHKDMM